VTLPAASLATWLSVVTALFAAVAAVAAIIALVFARKTVFFASQTVLKSDDARRDAAVQHSEQMGGMTALTNGIRTANVAATEREQTETEHRQVAQVQRIAELLLQTEAVADAEAEGARTNGAPSRLPLMLWQIAIAKGAWLATADVNPDRNPYADALLDLAPLLWDENNPGDVSGKCASLLMSINKSLATATINRAAHQIEPTANAIDWLRKGREKGGFEGYLLDLLGSEGPKTEADLIAAVHNAPGWAQQIPAWLAQASHNGLIKAVVPAGGVIQRWHITKAGRAASGIQSSRPD
jgi:hypothetical protein